MRRRGRKRSVVDGNVLRFLVLLCHGRSSNPPVSLAYFPLEQVPYARDSKVDDSLQDHADGCNIFWISHLLVFFVAAIGVSQPNEGRTVAGTARQGEDTLFRDILPLGIALLLPVASHIF